MYTASVQGIHLYFDIHTPIIETVIVYTVWIVVSISLRYHAQITITQVVALGHGNPSMSVRVMGNGHGRVPLPN